MSYSTGVRVSTHIAIDKNRVSHQRERDHDKVFLRDGQEFEIELRNNHDVNVGVKIKLNGQWISHTRLVLYPGQSWYLDRYVNEQVKFRFDTYEVDNTPEAKSAIRNNGLVEVFWYKERQPYNLLPDYYTIKTTWPVGQTPDPIWIYYNGSTTTGVGNSIPTGITRGEMQLNSVNVQYSSDSIMSSSPTSTTSIETGRVGKGSASEQSFESVDMQFATTPFATHKILILPISQQEVQNVRLYCAGCGRRQKKKENYCPQCGRRN